MASYDPRSKRPQPAVDSPASETDTPNQVDALLGDPSREKPVGDKLAGDAPVVSKPVPDKSVAEKPVPEKSVPEKRNGTSGPESPSITVTVAQSPVEPAGPPGPGVAKFIAGGAGLAALLGGIFAWRRRRSGGK